MKHVLDLWHGWFVWIFLFCTAILLANMIHYLLFWALKRQTAPSVNRRLHPWRHLSNPARAIFLITCLLIAFPYLPLAASVLGPVREAFNLLLVAAIGWLCIGGIYLAEEVLILRYDVSAEDNLRARRVRTQTQVLRRLAIALIVILDAGAMLWTSQNTQLLHYGTGLIASAGLASLALAAAAKTTVGNVLAGLQIAITEPIRIDDVVVIDKEWGRIEEITGAYVVVKIWDLRRLIVPLSYWIEHPFQNWTRQSASLLAYAYMHVDYTVPVEELRKQHTKILQAAPMWDHQVDVVQVTHLGEQTIEVRFLSSAANSNDQWNIRCLVREEMLKFVRENYPGALPHNRVAMSAVHIEDERSLDAPRGGSQARDPFAFDGAQGSEGVEGRAPRPGNGAKPGAAG